MNTTASTYVPRTPSPRRVLRAYVEDCQRGKNCPLSGDVDSGVSQVREFLESTKAAPLPTSDDKRPLTYDLAVYGVLGSFFMPFLALTLLFLLNSRHVPERWRNHWPANVVLALVAWTVVRNWPGFPLVPTVSTG